MVCLVLTSITCCKSKLQSSVKTAAFGLFNLNACAAGSSFSMAQYVSAIPLWWKPCDSPEKTHQYLFIALELKNYSTKTKAPLGKHFGAMVNPLIFTNRKAHKEWLRAPLTRLEDQDKGSQNQLALSNSCDPSVPVIPALGKKLQLQQ